MRTQFMRALLVLIAVVLSAASGVAQVPDKNAPADKYACEGCVTKVFQLPSTSTPYEIQEVVNTFRVIADFRFIYSDPAQHTISTTGTPEQMAVANELFDFMRSVPSVGDRRVSVLIHEPQGTKLRDTGTVPSSKNARDLASSYIKALYVPRSSLDEMQSLSKALHYTVGIQRLGFSASTHVLYIRGTAEQMAQADRLISE